MKSSVVAELISKNMSAFYGYAFERLFDKDKAEDLASEIICEILSSSENLKNDNAFWGFAWKIAENTFRKYIRRNKLISQNIDLNDNIEYGGFINSPLYEHIEKEEKDEEIYLLRRELSLLSSVHRNITVSYYIHNKNCQEIAKEQNMSVEMVKYHLFKSRKILKEGVGMTRKLGEKSYNPGVFRLNFWGDFSSSKYWAMFERSLPGAIMLASYEKPLSAEELSVELGVSMPYLEEELEILESAEMIKKVGTKYRANIVIITNEFEKELIKSVKDIYTKASREIFEKAKSLLSKVRKIDFAGNNFDDNRLLWLIINIAISNAIERIENHKSYPKLVLGGSGFIFGYDNDYENVSIKQIAHSFENNLEFIAISHRKIIACQNFEHTNFMDRWRVMHDAILQNKADESNRMLPIMVENGFVYCENGIVYPLFPVFNKENYKQICDLLEPVAEIARMCMEKICTRASAELTKITPSGVKEQCDDIVKIHYGTNTMGFIVECLIDENKLIVPKERTNLSIWGVNHN